MDQKNLTVVDDFSIVELEDRLELAAGRCNISCSGD
jgi:hypothetical protein